MTDARVILFSLMAGLFLAACSVEETPETDLKTVADAVKAEPIYQNIIRRAEDFETIPQPFVPTKRILASSENSSGLIFHEITLPAGAPGAPPHFHDQDEEFFYVVRGRLDVMSGDQVFQLGTGDFAALLPNTPHMFWNSSEAETKLIMAASGGGFEQFFDTIGAELEAARPETFMEAQPIILSHARKHGTHIDMSLLPQAAIPYYQPPSD